MPLRCPRGGQTLHQRDPLLVLRVKIPHFTNAERSVPPVTAAGKGGRNLPLQGRDDSRTPQNPLPWEPRFGGGKQDPEKLNPNTKRSQWRGSNPEWAPRCPSRFSPGGGPPALFTCSVKFLRKCLKDYSEWHLVDTGAVAFYSETFATGFCHPL